MKKLTSLDRVLTAIRLKQPDVVPTFESHIDGRVINQIKPGSTYEEFIEYMDIDALVFNELARDTYVTIDPTRGLAKDKWGAIRRFNVASEFVPVFVEGPIKSNDDLKGYKPPDANSLNYHVLEKWVRTYRGKRAIIAMTLDPFFSVTESLIGKMGYYKAVKTNPDLVYRLQEIAGDYHLQYVKNCIEIGVDIIWVVSDIATKMGPMLSPADTQKFIMPANKRIIDYAKSKGLPILRHSDGNLWPIFDMLLEWGYDGIHPIDPVAGMDLGEAKAKYGKRVCLMGNVDCAQLLTWGNEDEVCQAVRRCIRQAGYGGGYICTTSNTVHAGIKPANYVAMIKTIKEYGRYPLQV
jgi:uroporphyrinogen decarboxylase